MTNKPSGQAGLRPGSRIEEVVSMAGNQISEAVLEELKKLNSIMKSIQMDINAIKVVVEMHGMTVHVSNIPQIVQAIGKLAERKF